MKTVVDNSIAYNMYYCTSIRITMTLSTNIYHNNTVCTTTSKINCNTLIINTLRHKMFSKVEFVQECQIKILLKQLGFARTHFPRMKLRYRSPDKN